MKGLLLSLLFNVLSQIPDEIPSVFPEFSNSSTCNVPGLDSDLVITDCQLRKAFDILMSKVNVCGSGRFCFFIDGLDEFDDDDNSYSDLVDRLCKWVNDSSGTIKMCVSSRELPIFQTRLSPTKRIRLQDLTRSDIETVVHQALNRNSYFRRLDISHHEGCQKLATEIVNRSDGVFLWVNLVLKSVREGLDNRATLPKLYQRVKVTPRNLERFFECILESIHETDREEAYCAFSILTLKKERDEPFSLFRYSFLADILDDSEFALKLQIRDVSDSEIEARLEDASVRLSACFKGLIDIRPSDRFPLSYPGVSQQIPTLRQCIKFTHRTVPDFLDQRIKTYGQQYLKEVDIMRVNLESFLAEIKFMSFPTKEEPVGANNDDEENDHPFKFAEEIAWQLCDPIKSICHLSAAEQEAYFRLLDSVDEALCLRQGWLRCRDSLDINWDENWAVLTWNPGRRCADRRHAISIMHLAAYLGFERYLWWKTDQRPNSLNKDSEKLELFHSICHGIDRFGGRGDGKGPAPGLAMLEKLFHRGMSINQTPWTNSPANRDWHRSLWESWICAVTATYPTCYRWDIFAVFLELRADPRYWFAVASDGSNDVYLEFEQNVVETYNDAENFTIWELLSKRRDGRCSLREFVEYIQPYDADNMLKLIDRNIILLELEVRSL
jgi:hypothetical protein